MEFVQTYSFSGNTIAWSPVSLGVLFLGVLVLLCAPRKWTLPTFLTLSILMSMALHIVVVGFTLMPHRVLLLFAWSRCLMRGEHHGFKFSAMDTTFIFLNGCMVVTETLLGGGEGFVYAFANNLYDGVGTYFLCRILFRDAEDLNQAVRCLAGICLAIAGFMCAERLTGHNWLSVLGAVQDTVQERKGTIRCAASFSIPITAGTFGAVLLPFFVSCWWQRGRMKKWAVPGCIASTVITLTAGSAGPLSTYAVAIVGLLMWPLRRHMRTIRWTTGLSLLALHFAMKAPVWALIARIQVVPGASAWHRFNVLDAFIMNADKWWLYGVQSTEDWGWLVEDVANQFCIVAKHGGIVALLLFIRLIALGFREVGLRVNKAGDDRPTGLMAWAFGVMLFAHVTSFFGISYFDQTKVLWYLSLAMLASLKLLAGPQEQGASTTLEKNATFQDEGFAKTPAIAH